MSESSILKEFRITLETVTPLFLGGAELRGIPNPLVTIPRRDGRPRYTANNVKGGEPELRPPSFRGALHYWLRVLAGGITSNDLSKLQEIESSVFGNAASADQGSASKVRVLFENEELKPSELFKREATEIVTKNGRELKQPSGRDYLYWSMDESGTGNRSKYQPPKKCFPKGSSFELVLSSRFLDGDALQKAVASLWMLIQFGGIGSRSHRTAGSLSPTSSKEFEGLQFQLKDGEPSQIAEELYDGLERAQKLMGLPVLTSMPPPEFDTISLTVDTFQSWILGPWKSSEEAVTAIGKSFRDFRTYRSPDHEEVYKWLNGSYISNVERSVFGLPIPYQYSSGNRPKGVIQGKEDVIERRASPLWLKVSKTRNGQHVVVATLFKSNFLPKDEKLMAIGVENAVGAVPPAIDQPPDYSLVEKWIDSMKTDKDNFRQ